MAKGTKYASVKKKLLYDVKKLLVFELYLAKGEMKNTFAMINKKASGNVARLNVRYNQNLDRP